MIERTAVARVLADALTDELVVSSLGYATRDLYAARDRVRNFYTAGAMGTCTAIAFGLAMTRQEDRVISLDGDGSLLMGLGVLATVGRYAPPNFTCIVLDNQRYQITGDQPTHTEATTDLATVARGCGIASATTVETLDDFRAALDRALTTPGPHMIVAKVDRSMQRIDMVGRGFVRALPWHKYRFMGGLGLLLEMEHLAWSRSP